MFSSCDNTSRSYGAQLAQAAFYKDGTSNGVRNARRTESYVLQTHAEEPNRVQIISEFHTWLPETVSEMMSEAAEAAHDIDSQYVVTYKPQSPLAEAKPGEYRKLDVISRRVGLRVRSRRGYVVVAANP
jgi:hypothetical protein